MMMASLLWLTTITWKKLPSGLAILQRQSHWGDQIVKEGPRPDSKIMISRIMKGVLFSLWPCCNVATYLCCTCRIGHLQATQSFVRAIVVMRHGFVIDASCLLVLCAQLCLLSCVLNCRIIVINCDAIFVILNSAMFYFFFCLVIEAWVRILLHFMLQFLHFFLAAHIHFIFRTCTFKL